jgi:hypothetical protein
MALGLLFAGLVLYLLVLIQGILPHSWMLRDDFVWGQWRLLLRYLGLTRSMVDRRLAVLMLILSLIMLSVGISLAWQGHLYILLLLAAPVIGLGIFGARKLMDKREKHD